MTYYAHSGNGKNGDERFETVGEHLQAVASTAASFADAFGCADQARIMGLLHDLGKYSAQFNRRLTIPGERSRDHWTLGALAATAFRKLGHFVAVAIYGHHVGLDSLSTYKDLCKNWDERIKDQPDLFTTTPEEAKQVSQCLADDGLMLPSLETGLSLRGDFAGDMLDVRMLFSTLVDADFIETEAHFEGDHQTPRRYRPDGPSLDIDKAISAYDQFRLRFANIPRLDNATATQFADLRRQLTEDCLKAGREMEQGLFTLSAPTGAGKTLAMLGFALQHAKRHALRRVVLVMPFINIIDQTARIYREIFTEDRFGNDYILEAHSLAGESVFSNSNVAVGGDAAVSQNEIRRRLLSQNWDAPIVLTTNVQILESMFSNRPGACRKLHRLAQSVILFDEVQTLPDKLAVATLATLRRLAAVGGPYRSSVVFATATQPAFSSLSSRVDELVESKKRTELAIGWNPREIVESPTQLYSIAAERVKVCWEEQSPRSVEDLALELASNEQVLCIVNLKRHAISLAHQLRDQVANPSHVLHLSTNMCTPHRLAVLAEIRKRLDASLPVQVVATQCVEAGVDLDFPNVYRALAPLEAIAQAAGRCNRSAGPNQGVVKVFQFDDRDEEGRQKCSYPPGYKNAVETTKSLLGALRLQNAGAVPELLNDPEKLRQYYRNLYSRVGRAEAIVNDERKILNAIKEGNFQAAAEQYKLIEGATLNVLVPYHQRGYGELRDWGIEPKRRTPKEIRGWEKRASEYAVSLYRPSSQQSDLFMRLLPVTFGDEDEQKDQSAAQWWYPAQEMNCYDDLIGLQLAEAEWIM